jgi:hypothetical protein
VSNTERVPEHLTAPRKPHPAGARADSDCDTADRSESPGRSASEDTSNLSASLGGSFTCHPYARAALPSAPSAGAPLFRYSPDTPTPLQRIRQKLLEDKSSRPAGFDTVPPVQLLTWLLRRRFSDPRGLDPSLYTSAPEMQDSSPDSCHPLSA